MPPKPDETAENSPSNLKATESNDEPLYSSVRSPKGSGDEQDAEEDKQCSREDARRDGRRMKEIYEHKVSTEARDFQCRFEFDIRGGRCVCTVV